MQNRSTFEKSAASADDKKGRHSCKIKTVSQVLIFIAGMTGTNSPYELEAPLKPLQRFDEIQPSPTHDDIFKGSNLIDIIHQTLFDFDCRHGGRF